MIVHVGRSRMFGIRPDLTSGCQPTSISTNLLRLATHFGDSAFLIPLSLAAVGIMIWNGQRLTAWRFAIAVDLLMGATVALKVSFYAIGGDATLNVLSPSGRAGFSVTVYGCLATVLAKQLRAAGNGAGEPSLPWLTYSAGSRSW